MPLASGSEGGFLFVRSRYLRLDPVVVVPEEAAITLEPELGGWATGRCVFPSGRSAEAHEIEISLDDRRRDGRRIGMIDGVEVEVHDDHTFELRALSPQKSYALQALAKGFVTHVDPALTVEAGQHLELDIPLRVGGTVSGVVRGGGRPMTGATVRARGIGQENLVETRSGHDGTFVLEGLAGGEKRLEARLAGWHEAESELLHVVEGNTPWRSRTVSARCGRRRCGRSTGRSSTSMATTAT
jgi:hypothetical protein